MREPPIKVPPELLEEARQRGRERAAEARREADEEAALEARRAELAAEDEEERILEEAELAAAREAEPDLFPPPPPSDGQLFGTLFAVALPTAGLVMLVVTLATGSTDKGFFFGMLATGVATWVVLRHLYRGDPK